MIENWIKEYGYEFTEKLCKGNNSRPKLNIRVNTLKLVETNYWIYFHPMVILFTKQNMQRMD